MMPGALVDRPEGTNNSMSVFVPASGIVSTDPAAALVF